MDGTLTFLLSLGDATFCAKPGRDSTCLAASLPQGPNDTTSFNIHFAFTSQYKAVTPRGPASHDQALPVGMAPGIAISVAALLLDA